MTKSGGRGTTGRSAGSQAFERVDLPQLTPADQYRLQDGDRAELKKLMTDEARLFKVYAHLKDLGAPPGELPRAILSEVPNLVDGVFYD